MRSVLMEKAPPRKAWVSSSYHAPSTMCDGAAWLMDSRRLVTVEETTPSRYTVTTLGLLAAACPVYVMTVWCHAKGVGR
jgi:hypothetical protein